MLTDYRWWRKLKKGIWYYVRPYDNLYDFQHMLYWINRNPSRSEIVLEVECYGNKNQNTYIFCPHCGIEMVSNNYCTSDAETVMYQCVRCGCKSEYQFDLAPVPILLSYTEGNIEIKSAEMINKLM